MLNYLPKQLLFLFGIVSSITLNSQILPSSRSTNWHDAGLTTIPTINSAQINILSVGGDNSGVAPNDNAFITALNHPSLANGGTIFFPEGTYRFRATLEVYNRNGIIIKGAGSDRTFFKFYSSEYISTWQWDAIHFRGALTGEEYLLNVNPTVGNNSITLNDASAFAPGDYIKLYQEDFSGIDCLGGNNESVNGNGDIHNCEARHSLAHFSKIVSRSGNTLFLDNPIRYDYQTNWNARVRKFNPTYYCGVESLSLEFIGLQLNNWQPKSIYFQLAAESWIKDVDSYNTGFGHFVVASSTNIEIKNCAGHSDFFGTQGGGRGYGIVFEYGANYCLAENNVLYELRHPMVVQSGANANVFGYNFSDRESNFWADIVLHGNYPFLNLFEGNVGEVYRGDNSSHGVNGPYNTFFRNRATAGITEYSGSTFNQNYIGNEVTGNFSINANSNFVFGNAINGAATQNLNDVSYYRGTPLAQDQECAWPQIGYPNAFDEHKTPAQLRYEHVEVIASDAENCNLNYDFIVTPLSAPEANDGAIALNPFFNDVNIHWNDFDQLNGSISNLSPGCYSVFIWDDAGCYNTETFEINSDVSCPGSLVVDLKIFLQGPYDSNTGLMRADLRSLVSFPLSSPYFEATNTNICGDEQIDNPSLLSNTGNNSIVDWVLVELRDGQNPSYVIQTKAALLQKDGDIVSASDGSSTLSFIDPSSQYNSAVFAIRHRNHLGVRTSVPVPIINGFPLELDFTSPSLNILGGNDAIFNHNGIRLLKSGDANGDGTIGVFDMNTSWRVQNAQPFDYNSSNADFNLDGIVNTLDKNLLWRINNGSIEILD